MTPQDYITKWRSVELKERTASHENGGEKVGHGSGGMSPLRAAQ